jgi:hypothetical protein
VPFADHAGPAQPVRLWSKPPTAVAATVPYVIAPTTKKAAVWLYGGLFLLGYVCVCVCVCIRQTSRAFSASARRCCSAESCSPVLSRLRCSSAFSSIRMLIVSRYTCICCANEARSPACARCSRASSAKAHAESATPDGAAAAGFTKDAGGGKSSAAAGSAGTPARGQSVTAGGNSVTVAASANDELADPAWRCRCFSSWGHGHHGKQVEIWALACRHNRPWP